MSEKTNVNENVPEANEEKVGVGKFFAYKSRDIALSTNFVVVGYLTLYATNVLGMDAGLVGTLLFASKAVDIFVDLIIGYIIDKSPVTRFGKARPYEFAIIGVWLGTVIMYSVPPSMGTVGKAIWIFTTYTLVHTVFTSLLNAANVPYTIRAFKSRQAVVKVSSFGGIFTTLGSMVVSISFPRLMASVATSASGWRNLVLMYAIPLTLIGLLRFVFVKEDVSDIEEGNEEPLDFSKIIEMLKKNKYAWIYGIILGSIQMLSTMNAAQFYFTEIVGDIGQYGTLQATTILMLVVMFIFPKIMKRYSLTGLVTFGILTGMTGYLLNFFAGDNMIMLTIAFLMTGFSMLPVTYLQTVFVMNLVDYNEMIGLPRMEGTTNSLGMLFGNVGMGLGSAVLGWALQLSGYEGMLTVQPDSALTMIRLLYSLIPIVILGVALFATRKFKNLDVILKEAE